MSERPWYKRYASDFVAGVSGLKAEQIGVYAVLLDLMYARRRKLEPDAAGLARVCGLSTRRFNQILRELAARPNKITIDSEGRISNPKFDKWLGSEAARPEKDGEKPEINQRKNEDKSEIKYGKKWHENGTTFFENNDLASKTASPPRTRARAPSRNQIPETRQGSKKPEEAQAPLPKPKFRPPDWVPLEAWSAFLEMRVKIRKPLTPHALDLAVTALDRLRKSGHDPTEVLNQSTLHDWQGLFPIRQEHNGHGNGRSNGHGKPTARGNFLKGAELYLAELEAQEPDSPDRAPGAALPAARNPRT